MPSRLSGAEIVGRALLKASREVQPATLILAGYAVPVLFSEVALSSRRLFSLSGRFVSTGKPVKLKPVKKPKLKRKR